jgi:hypothetical protein
MNIDWREQVVRKGFTFVAVLAWLTLSGPARAGSFDVSPRHYGAIINETLKQVGAEFRFEAAACATTTRLACHFSSGLVTALVTGDTTPPHINRIVIEADLMRDSPGAEPLVVLADSVLVFGASMVVFDRDLPPERRAQLASDLTVAALETGAAEGEGVAAHYWLTFDQGSSGVLVIVISPTDEAERGWALSSIERASRSAKRRPASSLADTGRALRPAVGPAGLKPAMMSRFGRQLAPYPEGPHAHRRPD